MRDATKAAIASAVLAPSVSTTVRTAAGPATGAVLRPPAADAPSFVPEPVPTGDAACVEVPGAGVGAAVLGVAPGAGLEGGVPAGLGAAPGAPAGRGGKEILMVSLRRSAGGLGATVGAPGAVTGEAGTPGTAAAPGGLGSGGTPGTPGGFGKEGAAGATGAGGLGMEGGAKRMVSFLSPGGTGA